MRHQQNKTGKQQQAQNAKLGIWTALQNPVAPAEVIGKWHQQEEQSSEDQHGTATQNTFLGQASRPCCVLSTSIKAAVQSCTTRFPRNSCVVRACHGCGTNGGRLLSHIS
jgi:hypothetical protein